MHPEFLTLHELYLARRAIAKFMRPTPLIESTALSVRTDANVLLKVESLQVTGSFKVRGAANRLLNLTEDERQRGVVTVSTGNHGRALAYVAQRLGLRAVVCAPDLVLPHKLEAIRRLGAEVVVHGANQDEAEHHALQFAREDGLTLVSPFDDPLIIAGQGTIGLEILEEAPSVETVVVPLSGGGLISGVALAFKSASPRTRIVGVSMARGAVMAASLRAGRPVQLPEEKTLADSLMGGIGLENRYTFGMVQSLVDDVVLLSEEEIAETMAWLLRSERLVVEGGGAVAAGALYHGKVQNPGQNVVAVISGGNVEMDTLLRISSRQD